MKSTIVILTQNKLEFTKECIKSIRKYTSDLAYEIIVIDNNSTDGTKDWLKNQHDIKVIFNCENVGFPKGCNQGINNSTGDNIVLLNNDTIVTKNWLSNMLKCLYSSDDIGAVGPLTNRSAYYQAIETKYSNINELQKFAEKFNVPNESKWEERLKLIGFCMVIKRNVIEKTGLLDERFTPGSYEDDDYSVRIIKSGYRLFLCKDTFIHHYGGATFTPDSEFARLQAINEKKFEKKWSFSSRKCMAINRHITEIIKEKENSNFSILHIGCGCGGTLLYLKDKYKNAKFYGIDKNKKAVELGYFLEDSLSSDIRNTKEIVENFRNIEFDYILIGSILDENYNNENILRKLKSILSVNGKLLIELSFLYGKKPLPEYYLDLINNCGYEITDGIKIKDENGLKYVIFQAAVKNVLTGSGNMEKLLKNIEEKINLDESINQIFNCLKDKSINIDKLIALIKQNNNDKCEALNTLGVKAYEKQLGDFVLPFFNASLKINPKHRDTLINLGTVLNIIGEHELSVMYLEKVEPMDEDTSAFIQEIKEKYIAPQQIIKQELKFALRRIENDIDVEESREEIYKMISGKKVTVEDIFETVKKDIIKKDEVLNSIGVKFYEKRLYDDIIPIFQKSYEYNAENSDTIYNLGYFLYELGEKKLALTYFEKIQGINHEVDELLKKIKEEL